MSANDRVGGEGGIRTHDADNCTTAFETALRRPFVKGGANSRGDWRLAAGLKDRMIKVQITLVASPIISVPSDELVAQIHDRMPLIL
jgi:hypothetical protein